MSAPEDSNIEQTPLPAWRNKENTFFNRVKETVLLLARLDKDHTAKYYGDLSNDCLDLYKPTFSEIFAKAKKVDKLPIEERMNPDHYETEDEKKVIMCLRGLQQERERVFKGDYQEKERCYDICEATYPRKTGSMNMVYRHSCKRECENNFTKNVRPKLHQLNVIKSEEENANKETINIDEQRD